MVGGSCLDEYNTVTQIVGVCEDGYEMVAGTCLCQCDFFAVPC